jgi:tetratricopeptide (TPR) repeat protein
LAISILKKMLQVIALLLLQVLQGRPESPREKGLALYKQKAYAEAAAELEKAVSAEKAGSPEAQECILALGQSYFMLSQSPKAIPWLEKIPGSNEANYMLGYAYLQASQPAKSEAAFARLFGLPANSAAGHVMAAQMMLKKDLDTEAAREIEQALVLNPKIPEAHFLSGEISIFRGRNSEAIEELRKELAINPNHAKAWYRLGDAYTRSEQWSEAIADLQRAVWLNPEYSGPYILLGKCYLKTANLGNAEGILRRAIALDPGNREANYLLGQTLMGQGKREEARAVLERLKK